MINNDDDNLDNIDLDELFNDFNEQQSSIPKTNQDDLIEFNENDCTAPRINRKRPKTKKKNNTKQMTMYHYASSISYKHKNFYSSLDNTTTTKTILKGQKRPITEYQSSSSPISKKLKIINYENVSSTSPDLIDNLLQYLDQRSRNIVKQETLKTDDMKNEKNIKSSVL